MLTVGPLKDILDFICESKILCKNRTPVLEKTYTAIQRMQYLAEMLQQYDTEVVLTLSTLDTMSTVPIPDGYIYVAITPIEQLKMSMKRCACLLHMMVSRYPVSENIPKIDKAWITCLQNIIAYKSSWFKLFEILNHSQPEIHRMVAVFSQVRKCLALTNTYAYDIEKLHTNKYYQYVSTHIPVPKEIQNVILSFISLSVII